MAKLKITPIGINKHPTCHLNDGIVDVVGGDDASGGGGGGRWWRGWAQEW